MDSKGHVECRYGIPYRDYFMAPIQGLAWDLCPFGFPEILTVAHMLLPVFSPSPII